MRLDGKVCLITGGGGGLGAAGCQRFAEEGATVVVSDLDGDAAERTAQLIRDHGLIAFAQRLDVTDEDAVAEHMAWAHEHYGHIDVLYNNSGVSLAEDGSPQETTLDTWRKTFAVNVEGVFLCSKYALEYMLRGTGGSIINVASFVAHVGSATPQVAYAASKGAVLSMTREMAATYGKAGIRVNALCPGPVRTPLLEKYLEDEAQAQRRLVHIPMGRFGEANEIVNGAVFLASDESSFMTGQSLLIDGGITSAYTTPL